MSECVVIGGGLIGLSTALHLRWLGASVRVVERARIGDGTSTRASGWISAHLRTPNELLAVVIASLQYFPELVARLDDDCGFGLCGSLVVLDSDAQLEQRRLLDAEQRKVAGYAGAVFLDRDEVRTLVPRIAEHITAGAYYAGDAQVDPVRLVRSLQRAALTAGVVVHQGADVTGIARDGAGWRITTSIGDFRADRIVNAAGAWSGAVAEYSGYDLPIVPIAGQLLVSVPTERITEPCVIYQPDPRFGNRFACGVRQAPDGRLWLGTTYRPGSFDTAVTVEDTHTILAGATTIFPSVRDVGVEQAWAGVRPVPVDLVPVYGAVPGDTGLYAAVPVAGLAECAIAGRAMADLVTGRPRRIDLDACSPGRFAA